MARIPVYFCPSDDAPGRAWQHTVFFGTPPPGVSQSSGEPFGRSNYNVCVGRAVVSTLQFQSAAPGPPSIYDNGGAFSAHRGRKAMDFRDGLSTTTMASEVLAGKLDTDVPGDYTTDVRGLWTYVHGGSSYSHFATPNTEIPDTYRVTYCQPFDGGPYDAILLGDDYSIKIAARSRHSGGVNVAFADGHVSFVSNDVDLVTWQAAATVAGGEVAGGL